MDARGFDSGVPRTNARGSVLRLRDAVFVVGTVGVCAAAITVSVATGAWTPSLAVTTGRGLPAAGATVRR